MTLGGPLYKHIEFCRNRNGRWEDNHVFLKLLPKVLQILGVEVIFLGFICWMATLWVRYEYIPYPHTINGTTVSVTASPEYVYSLAALADLSQALTHAPPYIALTILGILLIAAGTALRQLVANR